MNRWTLPLLLLTACGGTPISQTLTDGAVTTDAVSTLDGGGGGLPIEQLGATLIQAACESLLRCPATGDNATVRILFSSVPNCVASVQRLGNNDIADLQRGVREGRIRYDAAAAGRCLASIRARCDVSLALDELCGDVFQGSIAVGGQCFRQEECAGDAYCRGDAACPGVCTARRAAGMMCDADRQCAANGAVPGRCHVEPMAVQGRCVQLQNGSPASEGQPCGVVVAMGASTGSKVECAAPFYCRRESGAPQGTCQRLLTLGSPCRNGDSCEGDAVCASSMCRRFTLQTAAGASCDQAMFQVCNPVSNLQCVMGRCAAPGDGTAGSACATGDLVEAFSCGEGLFCDRTSRRCTARRAAGQACMSERECVSNACSDGRCLDRRCLLNR